MARRFQVTGPWDKCTEWPPNDIITVKVTHLLSTSIRELHISLHCCSIGNCFWATCLSETSAVNDLKWSRLQKGRLQKGIPYTYNNYPWLTNFHPFCSTASPSLCRPFWDNVPNDHQMTFILGLFGTLCQNETLNNKKKLPHIHITIIHDSHSFTMASCYLATDYFERSAANDPKLALNTKRLRYPIHI